MVKEFQKNPRPRSDDGSRRYDRKLKQLVTRFLELDGEELLLPEEKELFLFILRKQRKDGRISAPDEYYLNAIEIEECEESCIVKVDDPPSCHHLKKDLKCRYRYDGEDGRYIVFVPRVVPSSHQMTKRLIEKKEMGHQISEEEWPKPRTLIHRISINAQEFGAWFDTLEEVDGEEVNAAEEIFEF